MTEQTQTTAGRLTEALGGARNSKIAEVAAEIDALTAERDDVRDAYAAQGAILVAARMEIESLKANVVGWQVKAGDVGNKLVRSEQEAQRLTAERDELRAEVERLRLPAEAWEAQEALRWSPSGTTHVQEDALIEKANAAAARARAAKVTP